MWAYWWGSHLSYSALSSWRNLHALDKLFAESLLLFAHCLVIKVQGMLCIVRALWRPLAKVSIFALIEVNLQKIHKYTWLQEIPTGWSRWDFSTFKCLLYLFVQLREALFYFHSAGNRCFQGYNSDCRHLSQKSHNTSWIPLDQNGSQM